MKKRWRVVLLALLLFLSGCSNKIENTLNCEEESEMDAVRSIAKSEGLLILDIELPLNEGESLSCYALEDDTVYYAVDMPTGELEVEPDARFEQSMEKEIRSYNWRNNEEQLIYKYDIGYPIDTSDMGVCGNILYWEDYPRDVSYRVVGCMINQERVCDVLFDADDIGEDSYIITPQDDGERIFFYQKSENMSFLYTYDNGQIYRNSPPLFVNSAYEKPAKYKNEYAVVIQNNEVRTIAVMKDNQTLQEYSMADDVSMLQLNDRYITYVEDSEIKNRIFVIRRENEAQTILTSEPLFCYGLLDDYVIINLRDRIISVNLLNGERVELMSSNHDTYRWILQEDEERLSFTAMNHVYVIETE